MRLIGEKLRGLRLSNADDNTAWGSAGTLFRTCQYFHPLALRGQLHLVGNRSQGLSWCFKKCQEGRKMIIIHLIKDENPNQAFAYLDGTSSSQLEHSHPLACNLEENHPKANGIKARTPRASFSSSAKTPSSHLIEHDAISPVYLSLQVLLWHRTRRHAFIRYGACLAGQQSIRSIDGLLTSQ